MSNQQLLSAAERAIRSFLTTLTGSDAPLTFEEPSLTTQAEVLGDADAYLSIVHAGGPSGYAVLLDPGWLPMLSTAMLGEGLTVKDPDHEDFVLEVASQVFGTLRTQFATLGATLDEPAFEVVSPGTPFPGANLPDELTAYAFSMEVDGTAYQGLTLTPARNEVPTTPQSPENANAPRPNPAMDMGAAFGQAQPGMGSPGGGMGGIEVAPMALPDLGAEAIGGDGNSGASLGLLAEVELEVHVELGRRRLPLSDLMRLTVGSVIELEKLVGEPLEIYANGRLIAEGEAVVIEEQFGIRITRLSTPRTTSVTFRT